MVKKQSMYDAFDRVAATVKSCETVFHIESSEKMIANFANLYGFEETSFQIQYLKSLLTNKWTDICMENEIKCSKCIHKRGHTEYGFFDRCMLLDKNIYCYEGSVISRNKLTLDACPLLNKQK